MTGGVTEVEPASDVWRRAAVTVALVAAGLALAFIPLPWLDEISGGAVALVHRSFSIRALGLVGVAEGFIAVELLALLVPALRRRRHGTAAQRAGLTRAGWLVGLALTAVHAVVAMRYLAHVGRFGLYDEGVGTDLPRYAAAALALVAGTAVLCLLARGISRHGLGNGVAVLLATDVVAAMLAAYASILLPLLLRYVLPLLLAVIILVLFLRAVARRSDGARTPVRVPVPTSGLIPLPLASWGTLLAVGLVPSLEDRWPAVRRLTGAEDPFAASALTLAAAMALAPLCAWLFTRSDRVVASWQAAGRLDPDLVRAAARRAHRRSILLVTVLATVPLAWPHLGARLAVSALGLYIAAQVLTTALDVVAEARARARLGPLVPAYPFQRPYAAEAALAALAAAGIPAFGRARRFRAIEQLFAPYAPVELLVPAARVDEAVAICAPIACPERPPEAVGVRREVAS